MIPWFCMICNGRVRVSVSNFFPASSRLGRCWLKPPPTGVEEQEEEGPCLWHCRRGGGCSRATSPRYGGCTKRGQWRLVSLPKDPGPSGGCRSTWRPSSRGPRGPCPGLFLRPRNPHPLPRGKIQLGAGQQSFLGPQCPPPPESGPIGNCTRSPGDARGEGGGIQPFVNPALL